MPISWIVVLSYSRRFGYQGSLDIKVVRIVEICVISNSARGVIISLILFKGLEEILRTVREVN